MNMATDDKLKPISLFDIFTWPKTFSEGFGNREITILVPHRMDLLQNSNKRDKMNVTDKVSDDLYKFKICAQNCV